MDADWLKTQFEVNPEKTKADLAHTLGLEPSAISKILGCKRQIKAHEYMTMRRFFNLPTDGEKSLRPNVTSIDKKTAPYLHEQSDINNTPEQWIIPAGLLGERTSAPPDKIKVFKIREKTMEPDFKIGENVVVDLSDRNASPPGTFIISDGYGELIRQCELDTGSKPPKIRVSAAHKDFQAQLLELSEFQIIGRVIAKLQWL